MWLSSMQHFFSHLTSLDSDRGIFVCVWFLCNTVVCFSSLLTVYDSLHIQFLHQPSLTVARESLTLSPIHVWSLQCFTHSHLSSVIPGTSNHHSVIASFEVHYSDIGIWKTFPSECVQGQEFVEAQKEDFSALSWQYWTYYNPYFKPQHSSTFCLWNHHKV